MSDKEEHSSECSEESSSYESSSDEYEAIDPDEVGEEGTRGLSDILSAVGIDVGGKKQVLKDENGEPIQPVYTEDGKYEAPTIVDEDGNVVHENRALGTKGKVVVGAGGLALLGGAAAAATAVGVHYYKKKNKEGGSKDKKDKKGKKKKKDKKDKHGKKDKKDKKKKKKDKKKK